MFSLCLPLQESTHYVFGWGESKVQRHVPNPIPPWWIHHPLLLTWQNCYFSPQIPFCFSPLFQSHLLQNKKEWKLVVTCEGADKKKSKSKWTQHNTRCPWSPLKATVPSPWKSCFCLFFFPLSYFHFHFHFQL